MALTRVGKVGWGGEVLYKRPEYVATRPLNWELWNKARGWGGGWGSVCGTQTDGNMDPLVKEACVWADGGPIHE